MELPPYLSRKNFQPQIKEGPSENLQMVVTIPAHNEPGLLNTLEALWNCGRPEADVEVIVLINHSKASDKTTQNCNKTVYEQALDWLKKHQDEQLRFHILYQPDLPPKKAGVGLARQLAMDEAFYRLNLAGAKRGIITGFDADSTCTCNYLQAVFNQYKQMPQTTGTSIFFEHPLKGSRHQQLIYKRIQEYELYLRYYRLGLMHTTYPYAFHTLGSSFSVRADVYAKQGGMNQRKAGEDFYFLHKIMPLGNFHELNNCTVYPSPRASNRVPFGTGAAINKMLKNANAPFLTYAPEAFGIIRQFLSQYLLLFSGTPWSRLLPEGNEGQLLYEFLNKHEFNGALNKMYKQSPNAAIFHQRFFDWFTAFRILKFMNFSHQQYFKQLPVEKAAATMLGLHQQNAENLPSNTLDLLRYYRKLDREGLKMKP